MLVGFWGSIRNAMMARRYRIFTLGVIELMDKHTAINISEKIEKILEAFEIKKEQIYTITSDNGRNMVKTVEVLNEAQDPEFLNEDIDAGHLLSDVTINNIFSIKCAAHSLQLAIKDFLKQDESNSLIQKARTLAKVLRTPSNR